MKVILNGTAAEILAILSPQAFSALADIGEPKPNKIVKEAQIAPAPVISPTPKAPSPKVTPLAGEDTIRNRVLHQVMNAPHSTNADIAKEIGGNAKQVRVALKHFMGKKIIKSERIPGSHNVMRYSAI